MFFQKIQNLASQLARGFSGEICSWNVRRFYILGILLILFIFIKRLGMKYVCPVNQFKSKKYPRMFDMMQAFHNGFMPPSF